VSLQGEHADDAPMGEDGAGGGEEGDKHRPR
jgi:hypothetical protein